MHDVFAYQVSNVLQHGEVFVQHSTIIQHQSWHILLGIDGMKISLVRLGQALDGVLVIELYLISVDSDIGSEGSNERSSTARIVSIE